jgi:hypothetical protein
MRSVGRALFWAGIGLMFLWLWWGALFQTPGVPVYQKIMYGVIGTSIGVLLVYHRMKIAFGAIGMSGRKDRSDKLGGDPSPGQPRL